MLEDAEYKSKLKSINADLSLHKSELEKVSAQYKDSANSVAALEAKHNALSSILSDLNQKHAAQTSMLESAKTAQQKYASEVERVKTELDALKSSASANAEQEGKLAKELSEAEKKLKEAANSVTYYQKQINYTERDQAKFNYELSDTDKYLDEARASANGCAASIDQYGKEVKQARQESEEFGDKSKHAVDTLASALAAAGVAAALKEIAQAIRECTDASIAFESAITGVYKTVDGTPEQLAEISDGIKQMSTEIPSTTTEIAAVAEAAGQLGIATEDVLAFSRVMLDLGESTNLSADEAATALARFANITGTAADDYERLGSVIVGLGNNFATTEAEITEMSTRLASAGTLAGLTESEIMALAAAMSSVGIEAEAGGTAMTQTLTAIEKAVSKGGEGLEEFSRISGMSAKEFAATWETDAISALQAFISGLGTLDEQGESATLVLDELGLSGVRQSNMLKSLALASDELGRAVGLANTAWSENVALSEEAGKRYETTESKLAMASNAFNNVKIAIGDALTPALEGLAEAGTDAFSWAAEFIEENPWLVQAITAVTAAVGTFVAGLTGLMIIKKLTSMVEGATGAISALNIVLHANPALAVAAAVAGLITLLGTLIPSIQKAIEGTSRLSEAAQEAKASFEEATEAAENQAESALNTVAALESLAEKENKTAAEKATLLELVNQLNESVPNLSLNYDEQTDSLNMTAEAVRALALAERDRAEAEAKAEYLKELTIDREDLLKQQEAAWASLQKAEEEYAGYDGAEAKTKLQQTVMDAAVARVDAARSTYDRLTDALAANAEEVGRVSEEYDALVVATGWATETAAITSAELDNLRDTCDSLAESTLSLTNAEDTLSSALKEQKDAGSLSLNTTLDLIDAGYAAALSINGETGAVTLNKDAYIAIAQAKIEEQIQALNTQRMSAITKAMMLEEASATLDAAVAYANKAKEAQLAERAAKGNVESVSDVVAAYDAQIAALQKSKSALGSYTGAVKSCSSASSAAAKKEKSQAEQDLAAYKELKAALDHEKAMGEIEDREYYDRLAKLRDEYLTDDENLDEYRKINEQIYKYDQDLLKSEEKLWEERSKEILANWQDNLDQMQAEAESALKEIQGKIEEIEAKRDAMADKLSSNVDLFSTETDKKGNKEYSLNDLQEYLDTTKQYGDTLKQLKAAGVSDGLMNEIVGMGVDDANAYGDLLLGLKPEDLEEYVRTWEEIGAESKRISEEYYGEELKSRQAEYDQKLAEALDGINMTVFESGEEWGQLLVDGLSSKEEELYAKAAEMARNTQAELSKAYVGYGALDVDGSHAGGLPYVPYDGYIAELHAGERVLTAEEARAYIARSMPSSYELPGNNGVASQMAAMVNAIGTLMQNGGGEQAINLTVQMKLENGVELYRATLPDLLAVARQQGKELRLE
nr:MAG TPA: minor tail protein [Caudoviricetes sp.]